MILYMYTQEEEKQTNKQSNDQKVRKRRGKKVTEFTLFDANLTKSKTYSWRWLLKSSQINQVPHGIFFSRKNSKRGTFAKVPCFHPLAFL